MANLGYGNKSIDFVIGSTYDQIASIYGIKTLVFKDSRHRALDLTFFNKKKTGKFYDSWVDAGEINIPGYITADEIIGIQMRTKDRARGASLS